MMKRIIIFFLMLLVVITFTNAQTDCKQGEKRNCGSYDKGECQFGTQYCENGKWGFCLDQLLPASEICDDIKDNDCDGQVDEGCECAFGDKKQCGPQNATGICKFGIEYCTDVGEWSGECVNATTAGVEKCGPLSQGNSLDDDCDGQVDEGCMNATSQSGGSLKCTNRQKDNNETGIDCGGSCAECNSCDNGILEKDEQKTSVDIGGGKISDCGGLNCPQCPTCNDKIKNQGEEDVDCGGSCAIKCDDEGKNDNDADGLNLNAELQKGTDPNKYDTDADGISDSSDQWPLCPNNFCDSLRGENEDTCPEDCQEEKGIGVALLIISIIILVGAVAFYIYYQAKKPGKSLKPISPWSGLSGSSEPFERPNNPSTRGYARSAIGQKRGQEKETDAEKKLRESLGKF